MQLLRCLEGYGVSRLLASIRNDALDLTADNSAREFVVLATSVDATEEDKSGRRRIVFLETVFLDLPRSWSRQRTESVTWQKAVPGLLSKPEGVSSLSCSQF